MIFQNISEDYNVNSICGIPCFVHHCQYYMTGAGHTDIWFSLDDSVNACGWFGSFYKNQNGVACHMLRPVGEWELKVAEL